VLVEDSGELVTVVDSCPEVVADPVVLEGLEPSGVVELGPWLDELWLSVSEEGLVLATFSLEPVLVGSSVDEPELCEVGLELVPSVVEL
jgi:hypothetical protein